MFENVYTVDVPYSTNRELFASDDANMTEENFLSHLETVSSDELQYMMGTVREKLSLYRPGKRILTDDKAPVELLSMSVLDEIINDEIGHIKTIEDLLNLIG